MVTVTSVNNGDKLLVSLDKQALKLLPEVVNHPTLSNEANWGKVSVVLKDSASIKRLVAAFTGDFTQPDYVTPKMTKKDQVFELHKIVISSPTRSTILSIKKDQVPNSSSVSVAMQKDVFFGLSIYPRILITSSGTTVSGLFKAYITVTEAVNGLSAEDIAVTNGSVSNLYTTSDPLTYEAEILPNAFGEVVVQILRGVVTSNTDVPNVASNRLIVENVGSSSSVSNDGYRYYMLSARSGWSNSQPASSIRINCLKFCWDNAIQSLSDYNTPYMKIPTFSNKYLFDDSINSTTPEYHQWSLTSGIYNNLIVVDLEEKRDVTSVLIRPHTDFFPKDFKLYGSNDNENWVEVLSVSESSSSQYNLWGYFANQYHKEYVIKIKQNEFSLLGSANWSQSLSWSPSVSPNSSAHSAILLGNQIIGSANTVKIDKNITLNKLILKPIWPVSVQTENQSVLTLDGQNAKILALNEIAYGDCNISAPIIFNSDAEIFSNSDAYFSITGKVISSNKNLKITQNSILSKKILFLSNENNEITGKIILDSEAVFIKNSTANNCEIEWSNKKSYSQPNGTVLKTGNNVFNSAISFLGDGDKLYALTSPSVVTYNGQFSGIITNGLYLSNCILNQSSNSLSFVNSKIHLSDGTLNIANAGAIPNDVPIEVGFNTTNKGPSSECHLYLPPSASIYNQIIYSGGGGPSDQLSLNSATSNIYFSDNSLYGNITISPQNGTVHTKQVKFSGSAEIHGDIDGTSLGTILRIVGSTTNIKIKGDCLAGFSSVKISGGANLTIEGSCNSPVTMDETQNNEFLNVTGSCLSVVAGSTSSIYGTGTINGNVTVSNATICPEDVGNPYGVWGVQENSFYGLTINGNLVLNSGSKFRPGFGNNDFEVSGLKVNGNIILAGTIQNSGVSYTSIDWGTTSTVITYTGTRTGTFTTNALGAGTTIIYDDANKRVLVSRGIAIR